MITNSLHLHTPIQVPCCYQQLQTFRKINGLGRSVASCTITRRPNPRQCATSAAVAQACGLVIGEKPDTITAGTPHAFHNLVGRAGDHLAPIAGKLDRRPGPISICEFDACNFQRADECPADDCFPFGIKCAF